MASSLKLFKTTHPTKTDNYLSVSLLIHKGKNMMTAYAFDLIKGRFGHFLY